MMIRYYLLKFHFNLSGFTVGQSSGKNKKKIKKKIKEYGKERNKISGGSY